MLDKFKERLIEMDVKKAPGRQRTPDMFPELIPPRPKRKVIAHVEDAGSNFPDGLSRATYRCKCGWESDWELVTSISAAKRGIPCGVCNGLTPAEPAVPTR